MGYWPIMKELYRTIIKDPQSRKAALGYALKLLPDMIMSGLFAIPVVGWFAGITGSFWGGKLENKGEKILKELESNLDPNNRLHSSLKHFRKGEIAWNAEKNQQYFGKPKPGKPPFQLAEYLAHKYNKVLDGWLAHIAPLLKDRLNMESVFRRLSLDWQGQTEKGPSKVFRTFKRWIEARQSLRQTKALGRVFNWMSGLKSPNMERVMPRALQRLMLLPRLGLQFLFFVLGKKPRF